MVVNFIKERDYYHKGRHMHSFHVRNSLNLIFVYNRGENINFKKIRKELITTDNYILEVKNIFKKYRSIDHSIILSRV